MNIALLKQLVVLGAILAVATTAIGCGIDDDFDTVWAINDSPDVVLVHLVTRNNYAYRIPPDRSGWLSQWGPPNSMGTGTLTVFGADCRMMGDFTFDRPKHVGLIVAPDGAPRLVLGKRLEEIRPDPPRPHLVPLDLSDLEGC